MKRGNDNAQMSREDFEAQEDNDEEEPSSSGTFQRASADVLATRKIVKIKRKGSTQPDEPSSAPAVASFNGFAPVPPKIVDQFAKQSPVKSNDSSDNELTKKVRKLNESFLRWAEKQMETHPLSIWKDGVKDYIKHYQSIEEKYGSGVESNALNGLSAQKATNDLPTSKTSAVVPDFSFGSAPLKSAATADATKAAAATAPAATASPFANFTFPSAPAAAPAPAMSKPLNGKTAPETFANFTFPSAPPAASAPAVAKPFEFNGAPAAAPSNPFSSGFTFGGATSSSIATAAAVAPKTAAGAPISFGATSAPAFSAPFGAGGFGSSSVPSFGGFGSSSGAAAAGGDEEGDGGDDEGEPILEPEKVLRNAADTDEILHEVPCKLYSYNTADKEWKDTGKGTFRITRDATSKKQRMLVRNTIGRINFNAAFFSGMKVEQVQKKLKFAAFVSVEDTTLGSDGKAAPARTEIKNFMLALKAEDVDATLKKMQAGVASV